MKRVNHILLILCSVLCLSHLSYSQKLEKAIIDKGHGGIGLEISKPNFGKYSGADEKWLGINVLSDMFEARLQLGDIGINSSREAGFSDTKLPEPPTYGTNYFGSNVSMGINYPISALGFGTEMGSFKTFRVHPFIAGHLGLYSFWPKNNTIGKDWYGYLGIRPGMRARLPFVTVDAVLNIETGIYSGDAKRPFRAVNISPSLVFRLNGQKQLFDMKYKSVAMNQVSYKNISSHSDTRTSYENGYKKTTTTTTTNYDVDVKYGQTTIQDIGGLFAIGPIVAVSNPRRYDFQSKSLLVGGNVTVKKSVFYTGLNVLVGEMGHGSEIREPDTKSKEIDRKVFNGKGSYSSFNVYGDLGFDISPLFLAMFGMGRGDIGDATPYFSLLGGLSIGVSQMRNQKFEDPTSGSRYDALLNNSNNKDIPSYRLDPREAGFGRMGGWWIGADVGVVSFKMQSLNHVKSPYASNRFFSLCYKIPLVGKK